MSDWLPRSVVAAILEREIAKRDDPDAASLEGRDPGGMQTLARELAAAGRMEEGGWFRRLYAIRGGVTTSRTGKRYVQRRVGIAIVDEILTALDLEHLWYTELEGPFEDDPEIILEEAPIEVARYRQNTKRRKDARLSEEALRELHRRHWAGEESKRSLARELVAQGVFGTATAADDAIRAGWAWFGLKARPRIAATVLATMTHGQLVGAKNHTTTLSKKLRARYKKRHRLEHGPWPSDGTPEEIRARIEHLRATYPSNRGRAA